MPKDSESLETIRHSTAHLMAQAVQQLFPSAQVTIGPAIEDGFYYDFATDEPFTPNDLEKIEQRMKELAQQDIPIKARTVTREEAIQLFSRLNEKYKVEIIKEIPKDESITLYEQGEFIDLCRGPHVPSTGSLKAFKLTKLAGAYWRGDSKNEMLQRIYGTAWLTQEDLDKYLKHLEEAEKRDHRKIGKEMDLFHVQPDAPGMAFWHDKGRKIYQAVIQYMREALRFDYQEVVTPQIMDRSLWEKSGHWSKFADLMFTTTSENHDFAVKPMNCPGHIQIYNQGLKSYRDLPLRMAEFGICHRNEPSGTLHGLMRIRQFTQDDAHVFCTEEQLQSEIIKLIDMVYQTYRDFGFDRIIIRLATRPEQRIGEDAVWDEAEKALEVALNKKGLEWELAPGEGAFYGPKIEFHLKDCLDRVWQCGTIQVDFSMPTRLGAQYVAEDGSKKIPIMIHRAILGSLERFIGILLEHYAGNLPLWLAPTQAIVLNITDKQADYAKQVVDALRNQGIRADVDLRNEKIGFKIREHTLQHVSYIVVVGQREMDTDQIAVRLLSGEDLGAMSIQDFVQKLHEQIKARQ
ncbi:MAG: threonine--tRNA ligase [Pseudomonadota bacterium]|nr:threonine--tRNA ligase [Gammaproteobacteria bacterium]MBU1629254.1 threonine--tRNA ligase [Gammaproteobacteria bacterium]MBU2545869.1 threonine--tRNA ligase [Gammaproteobacteria bacterium]